MDNKFLDKVKQKVATTKLAEVTKDLMSDAMDVEKEMQAMENQKIELSLTGKDLREWKKTNKQLKKIWKKLLTKLEKHLQQSQ